MRKNELNKRNYKKNILEYTLCLLILEILIIVINMIIISVNSKNDDNMIITEISKIENNVSNEISANNFKLEVLDCDETSYYIKVNYKLQTVTVYTLDENGEYTIPVKTMICSTGADTPTEGVYEISTKYEWAKLVGGVYGQYATRITGPILFHSVPYTEKDKSTLEYWEFDKLGTNASKGCVRLTVEDSKWIYDNCSSGTQVEFCADDSKNNKIEISKEKIMKISNYDDELRGWDPTDPDPDNPWTKYNEQDEGEIN